MTHEASIDELGPVDYLVVEFPADAQNFTGEMITERGRVGVIGRPVAHCGRGGCRGVSGSSARGQDGGGRSSGHSGPPPTPDLSTCERADIVERTTASSAARRALPTPTP